MLIKIPVFIAFDANPLHSRGHIDRAAGSRVFTMCLDTEDTGRPAQYCTEYPPKPESFWSTDSDNVLFALLPSTIDRQLRARAELDPESYCSDPVEGQRLAKELEEAYCTCAMSAVNSASIDPPERVTNRRCPVHGNLAARDPDAALQRQRDDHKM